MSVNISTETKTVSIANTQWNRTISYMRHYGYNVEFFEGYYFGELLLELQEAMSFVVTGGYTFGISQEEWAKEVEWLTKVNQVIGSATKIVTIT